MKRVILFSLLCVAFAGASKAQFENEEIEFESSGEAPTTDNPFRDDEDLGDESEGSGAMNSDYDPEVTVIPSIIPWTVGDNDLTSPAYDSTVFEEGGELVTTIWNKVWVPSLQNLTRTQTEHESGEVPIEPEDGGEVTFLDMTESTTTDPPEKKGSHNQGKSKSVEVEGETDTGSEETQENNSEIEEPVSETDPDKGVSDEVKGPDDSGVAVASTPSIQFLAAVIVGGCIGLLFAICVIMLLVYRMRKKDEGSYALDYGLDKKPQGNYEYTKGVDSKEYFA